MTSSSYSIDSYTTTISIGDKLENDTASLETQSWSRFRNSFSSISSAGKNLLYMRGKKGRTSDAVNIELPDRFCDVQSKDDDFSESGDDSLLSDDSMGEADQTALDENSLPINDLQKQSSFLPDTKIDSDKSKAIFVIIAIAIGVVCLIVLTSTMMGVYLFRLEEDDQPDSLSQTDLRATELTISDSNGTQEDLFRLARNIDRACSEDQLNVDMTECKSLCKNEMCCFEEDPAYNCAADREKSCVVHAGCKGLVDNEYSKS
mmetsp:Transcript_28331/g.57768  ORF Transcript_28331/g.57768 Transcript_28331/m.57768 type:complete len:261 (+) Transcript_28331:47-829(+)